jgi:calcium-dependent protein kinase
MVKLPLMTHVGTVFYMAPEVLDKKGYDEKCDVWACGCILYILLCGQPPFPGGDDSEVVKEIKRGKIDFDMSEFDCVHGEVRQLIHGMLVQDPKKRPTAHQCLSKVTIHRN